MIVVIILFVFIINAFGADKSAVTVLEFKTNGLDSSIGLQVTDAFSARLFESGKFNVIERSQLNSILKEQSLQSSGACTDNACMIEIGQLAGVQYLFVGNIGKLGNKLTINAKKLNVETGVIESQKYIIFDGSLEELILTKLPDFVDYFIYDPPKKLVFHRDTIFMKLGKNTQVSYDVIPINSSYEVGFKIFKKNILKIKNNKSFIPLNIGETKVAIYSIGNKKATDTIFVSVTDSSYKQNIKKSNGFITAIRAITGLSTIACLGAGWYFNKKVNDTYNTYNSARAENEATNLGNDIDNYKNIRKTLYIISGSSGAAFLISLPF